MSFGNLVLLEYSVHGITAELNLTKDLGFNYIIAITHPNSIGKCKTLEKVGLEFVKETTLLNVFLRKLYMLILR